ncbi:MAG: type IV secretion system protein [Candidatus Omnitrophica bacterium]|nr:type IV secretion system protein [Candidatus Omnitrophota bacterium]
MNLNPEQYKAVERQWNDQFARARRGQQHWQAATVLALLVNMALTAAVVYLNTRQQIIPYIVEVDELGRANYTTQLPPQDIRDEKIIRAFLYSYIDKARSVISDGEVMRKNFEELYAETDGAVRRNFLDEYYKTNNPFVKVKDGTVQVEPLSLLNQNNNAYILEWQETTRDQESKIIKEERWKALISITQNKKMTVEELEKNPLNPFGIYITGLSWAKLK